MAEGASPERRSAADLLHLLDGLIPQDRSTLSGDLPRVIDAFEQRRAFQLLMPEEKAELVNFCEANSDLEVTQDMLFGFISTITKAKSPEPTSPTPAPSTHHNGQRKPKHRRRSDRIRSPSSGSGSSTSSDEEQELSFPSFSSPGKLPASASTGAFSTPQQQQPWPHKRSLTLSDPPRFESPLALRARSGGVMPPSSFSRPLPKGRKTRRDSDGGSVQGDEDTSYTTQESTPPSYRRHTSTSSIHQRVRVSSSNSQLGSFTSPLQSPNGLDESSFHGASFGLEPDETDGVEMDLNPRLSCIYVESESSLRTSHDQLSALQKQNAELARKLREAEQKLMDLGSENETLIGDLQDRLEDARNEISTRRREDKEMKGKERAQLIQIANFESDIAALQRLLESSKVSYTNMQRLYNDQCAETQRLREVLRGRDAEISETEQATQAHEADHAKWESERQALEAATKRLESDLAVARKAETVLETQKQQNLELKETIDRLKFDLDEARAMVAGHGRAASATTSVPGTISRNLGDEIARQVNGSEAVDEMDEGEEENVTIVTTHRRRKVARDLKSATMPTIVRQEDYREYADASTSTDAPHTSTAEVQTDQSMAPLPPYSAEPEPLEHDAKVLARAHPEIEHCLSDDEDADEQYESITLALGVKCSVMEKKLEATRADRVKRSGSNASSRSRRSSASAPEDGSKRAKIINYIFLNQPATIQNNIAPLAAWSFAMLAVGVYFSPLLPAALYGLHGRDYQLFVQMNSLALVTGAGEGFSTGRGVLGLVGETARIVAGRVPI